MDTIEIKKAIAKILDELPEEILPDVLAEITKTKEAVARAQRGKFVKEIIKEDYELLKRLSD
ncbi:MAG: hypothetical protein WC615_21740 [Mucilaginibacter sp.]|jgi:hypothetical protein|uniref:hypothetical protein n=1 Tax=Mucilaginibacter sp. TaxID=1882438 RepID=UPI0035645606